MMICLLWGYKPFVVIETVVREPVKDEGGYVSRDQRRV